MYFAWHKGAHGTPCPVGADVLCMPPAFALHSRCVSGTGVWVMLLKVEVPLKSNPPVGIPNRCLCFFEMARPLRQCVSSVSYCPMRSNEPLRSIYSGAFLSSGGVAQCTRCVCLCRIVLNRSGAAGALADRGKRASSFTLRC